MAFRLPFFGRRTPLPRGHVAVEIDPITGEFDLRELEPMIEAELSPVLHKCMESVRELTLAARRREVETFIKETHRNLRMLDKLSRRAGRWEVEAKNVVPKERFDGVGGRGLIRLTVDGELGFVGVVVDPETHPGSALALCKEAYEEARSVALDRWRACLEGALESPDDGDLAKVDLERPAGAPEGDAESGDGDEPTHDFDDDPADDVAEADEETYDESTVDHVPGVPDDQHHSSAALDDDEDADDNEDPDATQQIPE